MGFKKFWLAILIVLSLVVPSYAATISSGGGHQIQLNQATPLTQRPKINCKGTLSCTDNAGNNSTDLEGLTVAVPAANYYVAGNGSDSNDCITTSTPCLTIQTAVNKIPRFFAGNTVLNIASGTYAELVTVEGFHPSGAYTVTIKGYINSTANQFSNVATVGQYTSSGSNTANFPTNTLSLFKDTTNSPFTTADNEQLLYITGGASWCSSASDDYKNWYRIANQVSTSQLSVVTRWNTCGNPILTPNITSLSTAPSGGTLTSSTNYFYRIVAYNANGDTLPSVRRYQTSDTTGNNETITINWGAISGATGYKVYGRTSGAELLMATWNGSSWSAGSGTATSWTDTGSVTPSGALPLENTTQTLPDNTTTYKIFRNANMSTITGSNTRDYGVYINDSSGIILQNISVTGAKTSGFHIYNSTIYKMIANVADSNYETSSVGTSFNSGFKFLYSSGDLLRANLSRNNYGHNYAFWGNSHLGTFSENLSTSSITDAGIHFINQSTADKIDTNLSTGDTYAGIDFESGMAVYWVSFNRVSGTLASPSFGAGHGLIAGENSSINFYDRNTFYNNAASGVLISSGHINYSGAYIDPAIIESINNGGSGIVVTGEGGCSNCDGFTLTGNVAPYSVNTVLDVHKETSLRIADEFASGNYTDGQIGALGWDMYWTSANAPTVTVSPLTTRPGAIRLTPNSVNNSNISLCPRICTETTGIFDITTSWDTTVIVSLPSVAIASMYAMYGMANAGGGTFKVYVSASYNDAYWTFKADGATNIYCSGSFTTYCITNVSLAADTWYKLRINKAGATIRLYINDTLKATMNTTATGQVQPQFFVQTSSTPTKMLDIDYFDFSIPSYVR